MLESLGPGWCRVASLRPPNQACGHGHAVAGLGTYANPTQLVALSKLSRVGRRSTWSLSERMGVVAGGHRGGQASGRASPAAWWSLGLGSTSSPNQLHGLGPQA